MTVPVRLSINGRTYQRDVEPRTLLVHFIRELAGLTGTKVGCDTSQCGACTVLVDGVAVKSCTCLAAPSSMAFICQTAEISPQMGMLRHHRNRHMRATHQMGSCRCSWGSRRGSPNYDAGSVEGALAKLRAAGLPERVVIDASPPVSFTTCSRYSLIRVTSTCEMK